MASIDDLIEERPQAALAVFMEFIEHPGWLYYMSKLRRELFGTDEQLRTCPLEKVEFARGFRKAIEYAMSIPEDIISTLKDDIALEKEAKAVEEARQPEVQKQ